MEGSGISSPLRLYELDWLRVIVTIDLIPFHVAWMMTSVPGFSFVETGTAVWNVLLLYVWFLSPIHMYLLFLVSGTSTSYSLRGRSPGRYVLERVRRLLIPLIVFVLFLFPLLGYFWPPSQYEAGTGYFEEFWPWCLSTTMHSPVTGGPNWAHMWFAAYLFIYSMLLLPLFLRIRSSRSGTVEKAAVFLAGGRCRIFIVGLPIALVFALLSPVWPFFRNNLYSDWGYFTYNLTAFFAGFVLALSRDIRDSFDRHAAVALAIGVVLSAVKIYMQVAGLSSPAYDARYALYSLVAGLNTWAWVVFVISIAHRKLSFTNRFLAYFSRISYPFYIFHLVVISVAGYFITRLRLSAVAEFVIICAVSFAGTVLCCELAKSNRVTRFMFGIKGKR